MNASQEQINKGNGYAKSSCKDCGAEWSWKCCEICEGVDRCRVCEKSGKPRYKCKRLHKCKVLIPCKCQCAATDYNTQYNTGRPGPSKCDFAKERPFIVRSPARAMEPCA